MSPILAFSLMAAKTWFFVIMVFGEVVYERGPMTQDICVEWEKDVLARMEQYEASGEVPMFLGERITRPDVLIKCEERR